MAGAGNGIIKLFGEDASDKNSRFEVRFAVGSDAEAAGLVVPAAWVEALPIAVWWKRSGDWLLVFGKVT